MKPKQALGYIYIVVFDNGTVKVGSSRFSADLRISAHLNYAAAFGISVAATFQVEIFVHTVGAWEKRMILAVSKFAENTHGREWFKFDVTEMALAFASSHLHEVAQMNAAGISPIINTPSNEKNTKPTREQKPIKKHWYHDIPALLHAIRVEGTISKVAQTMDLPSGTLKKWKDGGVPEHMIKALNKKYGRRKSPFDWKPKEQR